MSLTTVKMYGLTMAVEYTWHKEEKPSAESPGEPEWIEVQRVTHCGIPLDESFFDKYAEELEAQIKKETETP